MPRNLDNRVELATPIEDADAARRAARRARALPRRQPQRLGATRRRHLGAARDGDLPVDAQAELMERYTRRNELAS